MAGIDITTSAGWSDRDRYNYFGQGGVAGIGIATSGRVGWQV